MKKIEIDKRKRFYLVGIGGISMSALALFLKKHGNLVEGSDISHTEAVEMLEEEGISVDFSVEERKIAKADYVVVSSAIKEGDERLEVAKKHKKHIFTRGELLGEISKQFEKVVAVAGSHGKTTTTAMIFEILKVAGKNPSLHLGGWRSEDGQNHYFGGSEFFVTEACEYHNNFLHLFPSVAVITNIEREHMDFFKTFENQLRSFEQFRKQSEIVVEGCGEFSSKNIRHKKDGRLSFDLCEAGKKIMRLNLQICEEVNTQNCILAFRACKALGISNDDIKAGLEKFAGVRTRFERMKCEKFDNVICDYSHHPTEIEKAIVSARKIFNGKRLVMVFQPHTFSRTKDLLDDFVRVLKKVDVPILFKTYSAREEEKDGLSAKGLSRVLVKENSNTQYAGDFKTLKKLLEDLKRDDVIMFVGAGDLPRILHKNHFLS